MRMNVYHKKFLNSFTSENVIALFSRYNNSYKEITESWGMFEAAKKYVEKLDDCMVIVVGDGHSPRTGAIFAYYSKAEVISVDPQMNMEHWTEHYNKQTAMGFEPQRLTVLKSTIEELDIDCKGKPVIIVWPHSHASMNAVSITNYSSRVDIALPCCCPIPINWMKVPHITYTDTNILSPKNIVHVWKEQPHEI